MKMTLFGELSDTCVSRPWLDNPGLYSYIFQRFNGYKRGFLPDEGGLNSQPCKLVAMFPVIEEAIADCEKEHKRKSQAKGDHLRHMQTINTPGRGR